MDQHPNSHKITIHRIGTFLSKAQNAQTAEFFSQSKESIGSYFAAKTSAKIGSGLTREEVELLLPEFVDRTPADREFLEKVAEFFRDITTNVPYNGGLELEIGLEVANDKPLSKDNRPINASDYIRYRHALGHPFVSKSKEDGTGNTLKKFYIFDKQNTDTKTFKIETLRDSALTKYLSIKQDPKQVDQMLTLMGIDVRSITGKDAEERKLSKLRELAENPKTTEKFSTTFDAGDLEERGTLQSMLNTKVLKNIGRRYLIVESGKEIGGNLDEAIYWIKSEDNAEEVIMLKALLQEAMLKPVVEQSRQTVV